MMINQTGATASLDFWAQSGGAVKGAMDDVAALPDVGAVAASASINTLCGVIESELNAAAVTIGVTCGGWEPALKSAAYTHTIQCRGGW